MYNTSKYFSYIYADRNVRPCTIQGYTLATFPKVTQYILCTTREETGKRTLHKDPLKNAANYKSAGWRKDLEHVFKAYYKHNVTSFKEVEWVKMKDKFFTHLLQCKEEWRNIKENHPLQYTPYMEEHFYAATGLRLNGLRDFTG